MALIATHPGKERSKILLCASDRIRATPAGSSVSARFHPYGPSCFASWSNLVCSSSTDDPLFFSCDCKVASSASSGSWTSNASSSTLNRLVAFANRNWAPSACCTSSTDLSESNRRRTTFSIPGKDQPNDHSRPTNSTIGTDSAVNLADFIRLIASMRSASVSNSAGRTSFATFQSIIRGPPLAASRAAFGRSLGNVFSTVNSPRTHLQAGQQAVYHRRRQIWEVC
ncbi:hypothetical protein T265_11811 [Opisthorchis viverrini]|uniref:Uncharacterized protein n=1 Tax=Opisthorchis viverrini TaxID=6198 RepID=A0A074Z839_OPIVI|nr:hypothetical protein T265_11811 [Opisthorchis viverrini]KER19405.1 hypothetical protein T265_11811 [Opisthorchis viverrini]